jgi:hypothetical protein
LNRFGISDRGAAEFLDNHKQQILYGKLGSTAGGGVVSTIVVVVILSNDAIVATRIGHGFLMPATEFVRFLAFTIEGGDRFLVL